MMTLGPIICPGQAFHLLLLLIIHIIYIFTVEFEL